MNIIRNALSEIQLKYKIGKAVSEATNNSKLHIKAGDADDVIALAMDHPQYVLQAIYDRLMYDGYVSATTFLSIELLEQVVNNSSYGFHVVLADYGHLRNRLVDLACVGGDNATCRAVKGAARRLVLEFSRMFADDDRLSLLSRLADRVEVQSGRKLLRSILLEKKRVHIRSPRDGDIVLIDPIERPEGQSPRLPPSPIWTCSPCGFVNKSKHLRCIVCGSMKPRQQQSNSATQAGSPTSSSPPQFVSSPTNGPPTVSFDVQTGTVVAASPKKIANSPSEAQPQQLATGSEQSLTSSSEILVGKPVAADDGPLSPLVTSKTTAVDEGTDTTELATTDNVAETDVPSEQTVSEQGDQPIHEDGALDEDDAVVEAIVERSQSKEPLQNSQYVDKDGVHRLVEAEDVEAIRATLHHNAEVQEQQHVRRNSVSSLDTSATYTDPAEGLDDAEDKAELKTEVQESESATHAVQPVAEEVETETVAVTDVADTVDEVVSQSEAAAVSTVDSAPTAVDAETAPQLDVDNSEPTVEDKPAYSEEATETEGKTANAKVATGGKKNNKKKR